MQVVSLDRYIIMYSLLVLMQFIFGAVTAAVIFQDCGSAYELSEVNIKGCDMRQPCFVTLGEDVPVSLKFTANFVSRNLDQNVVININQLNLQTPVTPETCEINDCPVQTGKLSSFTSIMSVPRRMAVDQRGYLRWRIVNESGRLVLCYSVIVQTQSTVQKLLRQYLGIIPISTNTNNQTNFNYD